MPFELKPQESGTFRGFGIQNNAPAPQMFRRTSYSPTGGYSQTEMAPAPQQPPTPGMAPAMPSAPVSPSFLPPGYQAPSPGYVDAMNRTQEASSYRQSRQRNFDDSVRKNNDSHYLHPSKFDINDQPYSSPNMTGTTTSGSIPTSPSPNVGMAGGLPVGIAAPSAPSFNKSQIAQQEKYYTERVKNAAAALKANENDENARSVHQAAVTDLEGFRREQGGLNPREQSRAPSFPSSPPAPGMTSNYPGGYPAGVAAPTQSPPMAGRANSAAPAFEGGTTGTGEQYGGKQQYGKTMTEQTSHSMREVINNQNPNSTEGDKVNMFIAKLGEYGITPLEAKKVYEHFGQQGILDQRSTDQVLAPDQVSVPAKPRQVMQGGGNNNSRAGIYDTPQGRVVVDRNGQRVGENMPGIPGLPNEMKDVYVNRGPQPGSTPIRPQQAVARGTLSPAAQPAQAAAPTTQPQPQQTASASPVGEGQRHFSNQANRWYVVRGGQWQPE